MSQTSDDQPCHGISKQQKKNVIRALRAHDLRASSESDTSGSSSGSDESCDSDSEHLIVPAPLLEKFLRAIKWRDWKEAKKLCRKILLYEPYNPQILKFVPLIEKKIEIDQQLDGISDCDSCNDECCVFKKCRKARKKKKYWPCRVGEESEEEKREREEQYKELKAQVLKEKLLFAERGDEEDWIWEL